MTRTLPFAQFRDAALQALFLASAPLSSSLPRPEQRRSTRALTAGLYAACQPHDGRAAGERTGAVVDLSGEGVGVALTEPYPAGTVVGVELLDAAGEAACRVQARVLRTFQGPSGRWHHGCEVLADAASDD